MQKHGGQGPSEGEVKLIAMEEIRQESGRAEGRKKRNAA